MGSDYYTLRVVINGGQKQEICDLCFKDIRKREGFLDLHLPHLNDDDQPLAMHSGCAAALAGALLEAVFNETDYLARVMNKKPADGF